MQVHISIAGAETFANFPDNQMNEPLGGNEKLIWFSNELPLNLWKVMDSKDE